MSLMDALAYLDKTVDNVEGLPASPWRSDEVVTMLGELRAMLVAAPDEVADVELDLDAIEARANAATAGPWVQDLESFGHADVYTQDASMFGGTVHTHDDPYPRGGFNPAEDAAFIAAARQDVPALVAEVRRLRDAYLDADAFAQVNAMNHADFVRMREERDEALGGSAFSITAAHLVRQRDFSRETFGPGERLAGVLDHIRKELLEVEAEPQDISEWADLVILAFDGALRQRHEPQDVLDAIERKQTKNEARAWPDWRTMPLDKAIEHVRDGEGRG